MENILYGKLNATNTEVEYSTKIANCKEFIDKGILKGLDETPRGILKFMEDHKREMAILVGEIKYKEEIEIVKLLIE